MDFDRMKVVSSVSQHSQVPNNNKAVTDAAKVGSEEVKNVKETVKHDKEIAKAKELYATLVSDKKEDSNEDKTAVAYREKELDMIVAMANEKLAPIKKSFEYSINDKTKRINIKIYEADTKELIKEIPPEKAQEAIFKLWELAGLIVDEKG